MSIILDEMSRVDICRAQEEPRHVISRFAPADRREVLVQITEQGESLLCSLSQLHREQLSLIAPGLSDALSNTSPP
jgi:DNA-binding MarR family transcriptional regulator